MKKFLSLGLAVVMIATTFCPFSAMAEDTDDNESIICLEESESLSDLTSKELNNAEALVLTDQMYQEAALDEMKEILDNGTDLIVEGGTMSDIAESFNCETLQEEIGQVAGCLISSDGEAYKVSTIEYALMVDEEENVEFDETAMDEYLSDIVEKEPIDYELVINDVNSLQGVDKLNQLDETQIAKLQTATTLGSSFMDNDKFVYFYKYGKVNGTGTSYAYDSAGSKNGYAKLGSLSLLIYAIKIKTNGKTTYDTIYATCTASGLNDKRVCQFNTSISVSENDNNKIIDYTSPDGSESSETGSISTSINSKGETEAGVGISYTYNPNKLKSIVPVCGEKYVKTWKCTAYNKSKYSNYSWTVKPAIVLKKTNGTAEKVTVSVYVDYFKLSGGLRSYTMTKKESCSITFKNHKAA